MGRQLKGFVSILMTASTAVFGPGLSTRAFRNTQDMLISRAQRTALLKLIHFMFFVSVKANPLTQHFLATKSPHSSQIKNRDKSRFFIFNKFLDMNPIQTVSKCHLFQRETFCLTKATALPS